MTRVISLLITFLLITSCKDEDVHKTFYPDGKTKEIVELDGKGIKHGTYKKLYTNGRIMELAYYENGILASRKTEYYSNGKVKGSWSYYQGKINGIYTQYDSLGNVLTRSSFANNVQNGRTYFYHINGKIKSLKTYDNGKKQGTWYDYYNNGKVKRERIYRNDSLLFRREYDSLTRQETDQYRLIHVNFDKNSYTYGDSVRATVSFEGPIPKKEIYIQYLVNDSPVKNEDEFDSLSKGNYKVFNPLEKITLSLKPKYIGLNYLIVNLAFFDNDKFSSMTSWGGGKFYAQGTAL